ncbi:ornithine cyclodeaminase family protein, partial [Clostridium perfringens]|nr:ornithine cyclodeaminase family protein [Clostridium perfringens]
VFTMKDAIETNKECFKIFSEGKSEVPLRTTIQAPNHNGVFLFMPSYVEELDAAGLKVVNIFPENVKENLPTAPAQVLLIDGKTGIVTAILDGTYVTQLRTGASSGAAFDLFAIKDAKIGALIGTGGQATTQLEAMIVARELDEVRVFD